METKKSPLAWVMAFAGRHKGMYTASVAIAALGAVCGIVPYFLMGDMHRRLIACNRDWSAYLASGLMMAAFWAVLVLCHRPSPT